MIQILPEFFMGPLQRGDIHLNNQLSFAPCGKWDKEKLNLLLRVVQQPRQRCSSLTLVPDLAPKPRGK